MANFAIITPTIGRPSLESCIARAQQLMLPGDAHIVVFDSTRDPEAARSRERELAARELPMVRTALLSSLRSVSGNAQRDLAISMASSLEPLPAYLVFCDDDDLLCAAGADAIHAMPADGNLHLFPVRAGTKVIAPRPEVKIDMKDSLCGSNLVVPLRSDLPLWADVNTYAADPFFFARLKPLVPRIVSHDELLIEVQGWPDHTPKRWSRA